MSEESDKPKTSIRQVTEINPSGTYVIQFPENTTQEERQKFDELLTLARTEQKNVYLEPGVTALTLDSIKETKIKQAETVVVDEPVKEEPKPAEPAITPPPSQPPVQPQAQAPPAYVPPEYAVMPQYVQQAQGPAYSQQPVFQPRMVVQNPQQQQYYAGAAPQYGYVQPGMTTGQLQVVPQQMPTPLPEYNPNVLLPIGQAGAPVPQKGPAPHNPNATPGHNPYTQQ